MSSLEQFDNPQNSEKIPPAPDVVNISEGDKDLVQKALEGNPTLTREQKAEILKPKFIEQLAENLKSENLTLKQIDRLISLTANSRDDDPIGYFVRVMDAESNSSNGSTYKMSLRGLDLYHGGTNERTFSDLVKNTFTEVHTPTLKSSLPRHNDGLTYEDIDLKVTDIKQMLERLRGEVSAIQENDVDQVYDRKILDSYVKDLEYQPTRSLLWFFGLFKLHMFSELMRKKIKDLPQIFSSSNDLEDAYKKNSLNTDWAKTTIKNMVDSLGPDVAELPVEELHRLVKNKVDAWDKEEGEEREMKKFDPAI